MMLKKSVQCENSTSSLDTLRNIHFENICFLLWNVFLCFSFSKPDLCRIIFSRSAEKKLNKCENNFFWPSTQKNGNYQIFTWLFRQSTFCLVYKNMCSHTLSHDNYSTRWQKIKFSFCLRAFANCVPIICECGVWLGFSNCLLMIKCKTKRAQKK